MGAGKSRFESMSNVRELRNQRLTFNGRSLSGSTIGSMPSLVGSTGGESGQGSAAKDKAWTKYVDTLEDSLTESK